MHAARDHRRPALLRAPTSQRKANDTAPLQPTSSNQQPAIRSSSSTTKSESAATRKKVDELLKRMLPHTIVQTYDKANAALKIHVVVTVNGEPLALAAPTNTPVSDQWTAQQEVMSIKPALPKRAHPFHYARSAQYSPSHSEISLKTVKTLSVTLTSSSTACTTELFQTPTQVLTKKSWRRIAETDSKLGLALYELPLGPWNASSLVALAWAKTLEVVYFYLQSHVAEMLYACPPRAVRILPDDVDTTHGLHSYTVAITLRGLERVHWETECFSVQFPPLAGPQATVSVDLLDAENGYRDRARFLTSPAVLALSTDAISTTLETALALDVTVWEASCLPVWGFAKILPVTKREASRSASDFSLSVAGERRELLEMVYTDAVHGNTFTLQLEQPMASTQPRARRVFVKQATLTLSLAFVNKTFGTNYVTVKK